ncbi:hypothetical protein M3P05_15625 [Sansalvadorimonas sp. 2012CJ34-2]|uniref:Uncharacterized protein n=1 Tax=Parendozoicomonas callyspongiae TaxID=2942213 RepID=A0ABT0PJ13_9GAMM|nr:hypothetical protein [Sansalvadorimonas sp. 2012CJ34-2]MCL6271350.1 hypothetical protein [Sansalvadorimonas sp. 2012CJ34-2]
MNTEITSTKTVGGANLPGARSQPGGSQPGAGPAKFAGRDITKEEITSDMALHVMDQAQSELSKALESVGVLGTCCLQLYSRELITDAVYDMEQSFVPKAQRLDRLVRVLERNIKRHEQDNPGEGVEYCKKVAHCVTDTANRHIKEMIMAAAYSPDGVCAAFKKMMPKLKGALGSVDDFPSKLSSRFLITFKEYSFATSETQSADTKLFAVWESVHEMLENSPEKIMDLREALEKSLDTGYNREKIEDIFTYQGGRVVVPPKPGR